MMNRTFLLNVLGAFAGLVTFEALLLLASKAVLAVGAEIPEQRLPASAEPAKVAAHAQRTNAVRISTDGGFRTIESNGWPDHAPGAFPRKGNPNSASPQSYHFKVSLQPQVATAPVRGEGWWWGVAVNGVPFEPGTAETWNNDRRSGWRYEANTGFLDLGLDEHNAHVQPTGAYHYHALPAGLIELHGGDATKMLLVGWAADGFPIYTNRAPEAAGSAASPLREMRSSWRVKTGARPEQAGGPGGTFDGRFTEDFEFAPGSGDLDECNGRTGVTPEFPGGTYYYCITAQFPFLPRQWHGTPDESFHKGGPGPRGRGPGGPGSEEGARRPEQELRGLEGLRRQGEPGGGAPGGDFAGLPPGEPPPFIQALDANHDGVIDAAEIAASPAALRTLDRDGNGALSREELGPPPRR